MTAQREVHKAGEPVGLVQRCTRCGTTLQDYRGAMAVVDSVRGFPLHWWPVGQAILVEQSEHFGGHPSRTYSDQVPDCPLVEGRRK